MSTNALLLVQTSCLLISPFSISGLPAPLKHSGDNKFMTASTQTTLLPQLIPTSKLETLIGSWFNTHHSLNQFGARSLISKYHIHFQKSIPRDTQKCVTTFTLMPAVSFKLSDGSVHAPKVSPNKFAALLLVDDIADIDDMPDPPQSPPEQPSSKQMIGGRGFVFGVGFDDMRGVKWADIA